MGLTSTHCPRPTGEALARISPMTKVDVHVEVDHLEKLTRPSRRLAGIAELVWNAFDAEAEFDVVEVVDDHDAGTA